MLILIYNILSQLVNIYTLVICVYVLMSWIPFKSGIIADIDDILGRICDPYLNLFKKIIPPIGGMVDISPILAIIVLQLIMRVLYILI